jgi:chemotaxis protein CheX
MFHLSDPFFRSFAESTHRTLSMQCQTDAFATASFLKGERVQAPFDIAGLIGVTSDQIRGSIALCFPKRVFLHLMEKMLGQTSSEITSEDEDAAAELLNMIFGNAKKVLNEQGHRIQMAIPSVIRGGNVYSSYARLHTVHVLPFQTPAGEFYVEFLLQPLTREEKEAQTRQKASPGTAEAKAAFFKPFVDATVQTLQVQCDLHTTVGKPFQKKDSSEYSFDVAGIVGITSNTVNGSFMLSFGQETFFNLIERLIGEKHTEFDSGLEDAVSELVNIILGVAKAKLNDQGHGIQAALPAVIRGTQVLSKHQTQGQTISLPCTSEIGPFFVEIHVE